MADTQLLYLVGVYGESNGHRIHRCWGWYNTLKECEDRMLRDRLFFENRHYSHGLIEVYGYGDNLPITEETRWYTPVYEGTQVLFDTQVDIVRCEPPASVGNLIGFLL